MNYVTEIIEFVKLVDFVLDEIKVPRLFENVDFVLDELSMDTFLCFHLNQLDNDKVPLVITFTSDEINIGIDAVPEVFCWGNEYIRENRNDVINTIRYLLTGFILIEYYVFCKTKIVLFDYKGAVFKTFTYFELFKWIDRKSIRLYRPIYS